MRAGLSPINGLGGLCRCSWHASLKGRERLGTLAPDSTYAAGYRELVNPG
jgi:hypothetical protein